MGYSLSKELVERIKLVNAESEKVNKRSLEAKAKRKLLLEQISEKVSEFEEEYGISFPNIDNLEEFESFLGELLSTEEAKLSKQVEQAEKVNSLINSGDIEEAQRLLGYASEEDSKVSTPLKDEKVVETKEAEDLEVIESDEELDLDSLDDKPIEEDVVEDVVEEVVEKPVKPRPRKRPSIKTSDFDMGVSLSDLDEVAEEKSSGNFGSSMPTGGIVEEEVKEIKRPIRRRRLPVIKDDDSDVVGGSVSPVKSGGSFSWDD